MASTGRALLSVLAFFALSLSAYGQAPREQLTQMVQQLQKTPTDSALRERIVKLAAEIKPAPAIPEEANRFFVRGNVFQKEAKDASSYELAISAYREALRIAPWWGDAYFNLAAAQGSAGRFDDAIASQKLFIAAVPAGGAEAREAQNKIYALEARKEMTASESAQKARASTKAQEQQRISGAWRLTAETRPDGILRMEVIHVRQVPDGTWNISRDFFENNKAITKDEPWNPPETVYEVADGALIFKRFRYGTGRRVCGRFDAKGTVSAAGNALTFTYTAVPAADWSEESCVFRLKSFVETYTR